MKNISFFLEDAGFFMSKIKFLPETRIYISDFKMNEIREIDKEFFLKETYNYPRVIYNAYGQLIFIEKCKFCNTKSMSKELLIWKLKNFLYLYSEEGESILKNWLLFAIGLYNINFKRLNEVLKILKKEENVEVSNGDIFGNFDSEKEWFKRIEFFSKVAQEIEEYWNWYDFNKDKKKELDELKKIINLELETLELEKYKDFFEESQEKNKYLKEAKKIFQGYSSKTINGYIKLTQANLINKINSLIDSNENGVKITKENMYQECLNAKENARIRDILKYRKAPEYKDFYDLKKIIEYLKKKHNLKEPENYSIDFTYITCLKFETFKILKDYPLGEAYLKFNYSINGNWLDKVFEKHKIKGKEYYVLRKMNNIEDSWLPNDDRFLYEKEGEKTIESYNQEKEEYIIGKIYTKEEIKGFNSILVLIDKTLN